MGNSLRCSNSLMDSERFHTGVAWPHIFVRPCNISVSVSTVFARISCMIFSQQHKCSGTWCYDYFVSIISIHHVIELKLRNVSTHNSRTPRIGIAEQLWYNMATVISEAYHTTILISRSSEVLINYMQVSHISITHS